MIWDRERRIADARRENFYESRGLRPDSGGAGKFRGGLSAESCFIPHNTREIVQDTLSSGNAIPTSTGMMGGYPGTVNRYLFVRGSDILERLGRREMIEDIADVAGEATTLALRQENFVQYPADVYAVVWTAAGGFGDPMDRVPDMVLEDWINEAVSTKGAREIYGVVIDEHARTLDRAATKALRERTRRRRLERGERNPRKLVGGAALRITENLRIRLDRGEPHYCCAKCDADLGPARDNYKDHCLREIHPVCDATPLAGDPARFINETPEFRQFFCPGCGALIENEIAVSTDPVLRDIEIVPDQRLFRSEQEAAD
jgi:N-methylhydantoinase B